MNETLRVESEYFKAIGIDTEPYSDVEAECAYLIDSKHKAKMFILVHNPVQIQGLMLVHEINIEFREGHVVAWYAGKDCYFWASYGDAQWQTKAWALGMAVVRAATERILRGDK